MPLRSKPPRHLRRDPPINLPVCVQSYLGVVSLNPGREKGRVGEADMQTSGRQTDRHSELKLQGSGFLFTRQIFALDA